MDENIVDVHEYDEVSSLDSNIFYTAVQVAEILGENITTVRSWAKQEVLGDLLDIKRVNGRNVFTKVDIENLKFVQELRSKNFKISQIREIVSKRGFKYAEYDSGLIDTKDPLGFQALAISIAEENNKRLNECILKHENMLREFGVNLLQEVKLMLNENEKNVGSVLDEVCVSLDDKLPAMLNNTKSDIESIVSKEVNEGLNSIPETLDINNKQLKESVDELVSERINDLKIDIQESLEKQLEENQRSNEIIDKLRISMKENKKKSEEKENEGFFKRLFKR